MNNQPLSQSQTYLITGGCGSLGQAVIDNLYQGNVVRVLDIDEFGLSEVSRKHPNIRALYGDIRDPNRVDMAVNGADVIIHCAAMKNINITEYNIPELLATNISGTQNIVLSAIKNKVKQLVFVSSDKAVNPTTAYGASKLMGEHLVKWASQINTDTVWSIIRPCNFWQSRGNVFDIWARQHQSNSPLTLIKGNMHRYFVDIEQVALYIAIITATSNRNNYKNQIVIPRGEYVSIYNELKKRYPDDEIKYINPRPGEKLQEQLYYPWEIPVSYTKYRRVSW